MNFTMNIPGLKEAVMTNVEQVGEVVRIYVEMKRKVHRCPGCQMKTSRVHDDRIQN
jgi:transposase